MEFPFYVKNYNKKTPTKRSKKISKLNKELRKKISSKKRNHWNVKPEDIVSIYDQMNCDYCPKYDSTYFVDEMYLSTYSDDADNYVYEINYGNGVITQIT